jgi:hypothetical protein
MNKVKFKIYLNEKNIFEFSMYHTYVSILGVLGVLISLSSFVCAIISIGRSSVTNTALLFLVGLMFTVIQPGMIYLRSKSQSKKNKSVGAYIEYTFDENEIFITDGNLQDAINWESVIKIRNTRNLILLYTGYTTAFIIPRKCIENEFEGFKTLVNKKAVNAGGRVK